MPSRSSLALRRIAFAALLGTGPAFAERAGAPAPELAAASSVEGRIVGTEEGHLIVDVGGRAGAVAGDVAELWRPIELRHPVTGRKVSDRYRTGSLRITEVLDVVSFAETEGAVRQKPRPGDIVVMHTVRVAPPPKAPPPGNASVEGQAAPRDAEAEAAAALFESLRGKSLVDRVQRLEAWLRANASSRYAPAIAEELYLLRQLVAGEAQPPTAASGAPPPPAGTSEAVSPRAPVSSRVETAPASAPVAVRFNSPPRAMGGASLDIGVEVWGAPRGVVLHSRHAGEVSYVTAAMQPEGEHYWVARIPAERVRASRLEYFVEAVGEDGVSAPLVASVDAPLGIRIDDPPKPEPPLRHHSIASVYTDYADYNRLRGNDRVWQTEGLFGMRFTDVGVRAVRSGFGVYRGVGGSTDELDVQKLEPRKVGLTYGHIEGELGFSQTTSVIVRLALGLREAGVSGGGQLHVRIGSDRDTNLMLGGELLGGIGLKGMAQLELSPQGRVPVLFRTEVTNQPAGEASSGPASIATGQNEIGGRVIAQGGYRLFPPFVLFFRLSYQGRNIAHAGPGFGGGAQYEW